MSPKHTFPLNPILVVDDENHALDSFEIALHSVGFTNVITCADSREVMDIMRAKKPVLVLLDLIMPHISGEQLICEIHREFADTSILVVTAVEDIDTVVECISNGAMDYLLKPVEKAHLRSRVLRCLEMQDLQNENTILRRHLLKGGIEFPEVFQEIITQNSQMLSIFQYCESIARSNYPVLIIGETGTGKELIARAIHRLSGRSGKFVALNIASLDDSLFTDTMFGHVKGAFTGADDRRKGVVDLASGGTLFLDEIGDLSKRSQTKLLRLLQEREYTPIGSDAKRNANVRVLASTNRNVDQMLESGEFRNDLYYRLMSHHIELPLLRDRPDDIRLLLDHFLEQTSREMNKKKPRYHPELLNLLRCYHFPGNIRELKHLVADAVAKHKQKMLSSETFKKYIETASSSPLGGQAVLSPGFLEFETITFSEMEIPRLKEAILNLTRMLIKAAMRKSGGNQTIAARILGISQQSLSAKIAKLLNYK